MFVLTLNIECLSVLVRLEALCFREFFPIPLRQALCRDAPRRALTNVGVDQAGKGAAAGNHGGLSAHGISCLVAELLAGSTGKFCRAAETIRAKSGRSLSLLSVAGQKGREIRSKGESDTSLQRRKQNASKRIFNLKG